MIYSRAENDVVRQATGRHCSPMSSIDRVPDVTHLELQAAMGLDGDKAAYFHFAIGLGDLEMESHREHSHETFHLQPSKILPDTGAWAVQECQKGIWALCTSICGVGPLEPPIRFEFGRVWTPKSSIAVDSPCRYCQGGALGDMYVANCSWDCGVTG